MRSAPTFPTANGSSIRALFCRAELSSMPGSEDPFRRLAACIASRVANGAGKIDHSPT